MKLFKILPLILLAIINLACQLSERPQLDDIKTVLERAGKHHVPDSRVDVFNVNVAQKEKTFVITGEILNPALPAILLDSLKQVFPSQKFETNITVLPDDSLGDQTFGIVNISVANIRRHPRFQAELVNQTLLGTVVRLLKQENGFYYVQNRDRYLGWLHKQSVVAVDSLAAANWENAPAVVCVANYGLVTETASQIDSAILVDLVPGATLKQAKEHSSLLEVEMPDGKTGFVQKNLVIDKQNLDKIQATRDKIIATSQKFLGVPYLWGGTSAKGFDCSGYVQTVFRLNNFQLPRDASQMVKEGEEIVSGDHFENLLPGDLLFFGDKPGRISHVAIYMGDQLYIHSSTSVHINSLDSGHPLFSEYRRKTLQTAKRLL